MNRLTEYHNGVAVIKDKTLLKQAMQKLAEYEDAEEQGLLQRLKCKSGDDIWCIEEYYDGYQVTGFMYLTSVLNYVICCAAYTGYKIGEQLNHMENDSSEFEGTDVYIFKEERAFTSKEEAKLKLKEMGEMGHE